MAAAAAASLRFRFSTAGSRCSLTSRRAAPRLVAQVARLAQRNFGILAKNQPLFLTREAIFEGPGLGALRCDEQIEPTCIGELVVLIARLRFSGLNVREHECPHLSISCPQSASDRCEIGGHREQPTEIYTSSKSAKNQGFLGILRPFEKVVGGGSLHNL